VEADLRLAKKRLLVLGPTFRRNSSRSTLSAIDRYDGVFFRVARKNLKHVHDVDVVVMADDLTLVDGNSFLPYMPPKGEKWGKQAFSREAYEKARTKNKAILGRELGNGKYGEIYIAMGKKHAKALPDLSHHDVKVVFPTRGLIGEGAGVLLRKLHMRRTFLRKGVQNGLKCCCGIRERDIWKITRLCLKERLFRSFFI